MVTADKLQRNLLKTGQIIGIFSAIALIMVGIFFKDYRLKHLMFSAIFFYFTPSSDLNKSFPTNAS